MIVALGAGYGKAEEAAGSDVDPVVLEFGTQRVEAEAGSRFRRFGKLIAGDLRFDEEIVGHVPIEGVDHPVAVAESVGVRGLASGVELVVGIAGYIEPVAAPAFAVARAGQQTVYYFFERVRRFVGEEGVDLFGRGREAGEIVGGAAEEGALIGGLHRRESLFVQLRDYEAVDGGVCVGLRRVGLADRLERPEGALFGGYDVFAGFCGGGYWGVRPDCAGFYPGGDLFDFFVLEAALRRHFQLALLADGLDEQAVVRVARGDCRAGFTAFEQGLAGAHFEASHFRCGVAGEAVFREDRADAHFKELLRFVVGGVEQRG